MGSITGYNEVIGMISNKWWVSGSFLGWVSGFVWWVSRFSRFLLMDFWIFPMVWCFVCLKPRATSSWYPPGQQFTKWCVSTLSDFVQGVSPCNEETYQLRIPSGKLLQSYLRMAVEIAVFLIKKGDCSKLFEITRGYLEWAIPGFSSSLPPSLLG